MKDEETMNQENERNIDQAAQLNHQNANPEDMSLDDDCVAKDLLPLFV